MLTFPFWFLELAPYRARFSKLAFSVIHQVGVNHQAAKALSRLLISGKNTREQKYDVFYKQRPKHTKGGRNNTLCAV